MRVGRQDLYITFPVLYWMSETGPSRQPPALGCRKTGNDLSERCCAGPEPANRSAPSLRLSVRPAA